MVASNEYRLRFFWRKSNENPRRTARKRSPWPSSSRSSACASLLLAASLPIFACSDPGEDPIETDGEADSSTGDVPTCIEISEDITGDETWDDHIDDPSIPDYCVRAGIGIRGGAALTIAPGTSVAFDAGTSLRVDKAEAAALVAVGSPDAVIDLHGSTPEAGWWEGIEIGSADPRNRLEYVRLADAGGGGDVFADDELGGVAAGLVLDAEPGAPASVALSHVTFERNLGFGLVVEWISELRAFSANTFIDNAEGAALLSRGNVHLVDPETTFSGNGFDGIAVTDVTNLVLSTPVTWRALSSGSYWIREPLEILSDLTLEAGASLVFAAGTSLSVPQDADDTAAAFVVDGTAEAPVRFTAEQEVAGFWEGLEIASGQVTNRIDHADIGYATSGIRLRKAGAFPPASLDVRNTAIHDSSTCGIENTSPDNTLSVTDVTFENNASDRCDPE